MKKTALLFLCLIFFNASALEAAKSICLNMIVKNESKVIERCLNSVKPIIDSWVIVDTGSTDDTQKIIREVLHDIPGELHERPWVNFEHNRNEALGFVQDKFDYVLIMDADEQLVFSEELIKSKLNQDCYYIITDTNGLQHARPQLINHHLKWKWEGVLHELLHCLDTLKTFQLLTGVINMHGADGARSQDPVKFKKDAQLLEELLKKDPENSRYVFCLAKSYQAANEYQLALKNYQKRSQMKGGDFEVYYSLYNTAQLQELLGENPKIFTQSYYQAYHASPNRAEPLFCLASYYRRSENYFLGYLLAKHGLSIPRAGFIDFVERPIYEHGLLLELSICAYYVGKYQESKDASDLLLANPELPKDIRALVEKNLGWIVPKLTPIQPMPEKQITFIPGEK